MKLREILEYSYKCEDIICKHIIEHHSQAEKLIRKWAINKLPKNIKITWTQDDYGDILLTTTDFFNYNFNNCHDQTKKTLERNNGT